MLKRLFQLLTIAAAVNLIYQYWPRSSGELVRVRGASGKYGFVDLDGRVRVDFEWSDVSDFDGSVATVELDDKFGLINRAGELVLPAEWDVISHFDQFGLAAVIKHEKEGYVNREGEFVYDVEWDRDQGALPLRFDDNGYIILRKDGRWGVGDTKGNILIPPVWRGIGRFGPQGITSAKDESGWVLLDASGKVVADGLPNYENIHMFTSTGLAWVTKGWSSKNGWIDVTGELVIPMDWDRTFDFDESGLAAVKKDGRWGWIDTTGRVVIPVEWEFSHGFNEHGYAAVASGDQWQIIDRGGKTIYSGEWDGGLLPFDGNGHAKVGRTDTGIGLISIDGQVVLEPEWDEIGNCDARGYREVKKGSKTGLVNSDGEIMFLKTGSLWSFDDNGLALFKETGKPNVKDFRGWINRQGEYVIPIPEGWKVLHTRQMCTVYSIYGETELTGLSRWISKMSAWLQGQPFNPSIYQSRILDKHGDLIWDSMWLRKTTKAWLYFITAMLTMLALIGIGRRKQKMKGQKS